MCNAICTRGKSLDLKECLHFLLNKQQTFHTSTQCHRKSVIPIAESGSDPGGSDASVRGASIR